MKLRVFIVSLVLVCVPFLALGADTPEAITNMPNELVPCGDAGQDSCQTCHLYQLTENVFEWFFGVTTFIVIMLIMYGGMRMVTSTGNQVAMRDARKLVSSAVIGFVLVLCAWTLVDLMLGTLSGRTAEGIFASIQCVEQPNPSGGVSGSRTQVCTSSHIGPNPPSASNPQCRCEPDFTNWRVEVWDCTCTSTLEPGQAPASGCSLTTP